MFKNKEQHKTTLQMYENAAVCDGNAPMQGIDNRVSPRQII
jgi:hypothetical protein